MKKDLKRKTEQNAALDDLQKSVETVCHTALKVIEFISEVSSELNHIERIALIVSLENEMETALKENETVKALKEMRLNNGK